MSTIEYISYPRNLESRPVLGLIRKDFENLRSRYPYLATLTIPYHSQENGLPERSDYSRIVKIEDKLEVGVRPLGEYIGHLVGEGRAILLFVFSNARPSPVTIRMGILNKEMFAFDPADWNWFDASARPSAQEIVISKYAPLYDQLSQAGDRHSAVRPVDFASHFKTSRGRDEFISAVTLRGFRLGSQGMWEPQPGDFWVEYVLDTSVEKFVMAPLVQELEESSHHFGGEFDGWACPVMR